ncbi:hypothetical protein [Martelella limonii]|uniref:hypothetical protein n=1 Tax=Martelella limonii TaxID=1647649 RepID=UPI0015810130|nr:hypothetical protein [Martelella limonii]
MNADKLSCFAKFALAQQESEVKKGCKQEAGGNCRQTFAKKKGESTDRLALDVPHSIHG